MEVYQLTPDNPPKGWKKAMGVFGWDGDELYITALATGVGAQVALMSACFDGEPVAESEGAILLRESWCRREFPKRAQVFDVIRQRALEVKGK